MNSTPPTSRLRGDVLKHVYRVWLLRKFLPVFIAEVLILAVFFYQLGQLVFVQQVISNWMDAFFRNPVSGVSFAVSAFAQASFLTKVVTFATAVLLALLLRHMTQGMLRLFLVKVNYFGKADS